MEISTFFIYLLVMAGVTYIVRAVPFVLVNKKIKNRYIRSFFEYIPYAVLTSMTVPDVFYSTGSVITATIGFAVAIVLACMKRNIVTVAVFASFAVLISSLVL